MASSTAAVGHFSIIPTYTIVSITLVLIHSYNKYRAHKHGNLLTSEMKSHAVAATISIILSCSLVLQQHDDEYTIKLIVLLLGALFTILMSVFFAAVADVWYVVGSGQFQMASLDTAGMMLYFILPAVVLFFRFLGMYGESVGSRVSNLMAYVVKSVGISAVDGDNGISSSFVLSLAMLVSVSVPILNALCPMGGYLFSRAYTHGQPNTKKVALCANFSDLESGENDLWEYLSQRKDEGEYTAVLNVYVTLNDLQSFPEAVKELAKKGHHVALAPSDPSGELSLFQGSEAANYVESIVNEYRKVIGTEPSWIAAYGRHPAMLGKATEFGIKVAYWSTLVQVGGDMLSVEQQDDISSDVADKNGGSIVHVTLGKDGSNEFLSASLLAIVNDLSSKGFTFESLLDVARDDATMIL